MSSKPAHSIFAHIPVIVELQNRLAEALNSLKSDIKELPEGEVRSVLAWQREEAALAVNKSKSYMQQLEATAKRNLKKVEE
jgi:hypothetical protein